MSATLFNFYCCLLEMTLIFRNQVNSNLGLLMAGFALLFVYISVVLGNFNWIEQRVCFLKQNFSQISKFKQKQVFLSVAGMLVIGLALGASFGLCFYIGLSINDVCPVIPFLLLGIGDSSINQTIKHSGTLHDHFIKFL